MTQFYVEPVIVTIRDTQIAISPLAVKHLAKATQLAAPLLGAFAEGEVNPADVLEHSDAVISLVAISTNQSEEFVGELNTAELVFLLEKTLVVNSSFFIQTIMPQVNSMMGAIQKAMKTASSDLKKA